LKSSRLWCKSRAVPATALLLHCVLPLLRSPAAPCPSVLPLDRVLLALAGQASAATACEDHVRLGCHGVLVHCGLVRTNRVDCTVDSCPGIRSAASTGGAGECVGPDSGRASALVQRVSRLSGRSAVPKSNRRALPGRPRDPRPGGEPFWEGCTPHPTSTRVVRAGLFRMEPSGLLHAVTTVCARPACDPARGAASLFIWVASSNSTRGNAQFKCATLLCAGNAPAKLHPFICVCAKQRACSASSFLFCRWPYRGCTCVGAEILR
jgi:hypothetical protein